MKMGGSRGEGWSAGILRTEWVDRGEIDGIWVARRRILILLRGWLLLIPTEPGTAPSGNPAGVDVGREDSG